MNKLKRLHLAIASFTLFGVSATVLVTSAFTSRNPKTVEAAVGSYTTDPATYYNSITATGGTSLLGQLHDLMATTHKTYTTYADNGANLYQQYTDVDPNNSNNIIDFYSGYSMSKAWDPNVTGGYNREHVWCQSHSNGLWGETGGGADMHHLRPLEMTENSTRNNHPFGEVTSHSASNLKYPKDKNKNLLTDYPGGYLEGDTWEPMDNKKGDVARILLYVYTHYNTYSNVGGTKDGSNASYFGTLPITNIMSPSTEADCFSMLVRWNALDPVDNLETTRNNKAAEFQGNRNPFIDHPEYVNAIWGDETLPSEPRISMPSEATVTVGSSTSVAATILNGTGTITYTSSNEDAAFVTNDGIVYGFAAGNTTITASAVVNGTTLTATCEVTVADESVSQTIGFEASEGFVASSIYNNTVEKLTGASGTQWGTISGTPTKTAAEVISGSQSMQMRYYKNGGVIPITYMTYDVQNITSLSFKVKMSGSNGCKVSYSSDSGATWVDKTTFAETTTAQTKTVDLTGTNANRIKFTVVLPASPVDKSKLTIDDVTLTTVSDAYNASKFADEFLTTMTCSGQGSITAITGTWSKLAVKYQSLSSSDQAIIRNAAANLDGSNIQKCVARYDYIIAKYGTSTYNNFINRSIDSSLAVFKANTIDNTDTICVVAMITCVITLSSGLFLIKRKKEQ